MRTEYEKCLAGEPFIGSEDPRITNNGNDFAHEAAVGTIQRDGLRRHGAQAILVARDAGQRGQRGACGH